MTEENQQRPMTVVFETYELVACRERALVLQAVGIPFEFIQLDGRYVLVVDADDADYAREQITLYENENKGWPPVLAELPRVSNGVIGTLCFGVLLVVLHWMAYAPAFDLDWLTAGRVDGRLMRTGEWWRAITALMLHADVAHLAGNVVIGSVFGLFVGQLLGQGLGWSLILFAGAMGNIVNVLLQHPSHRAIGASTAVFAALGVLTAYTWMHRQDVRFKLAYRIAPLVSGAVLLVYLGTGDARTDIVAHLTGFACGLGAGVFAARLPQRWRSDPMRQQQLGLAAVMACAIAWWLALA
ncbi:MAG: rhomboid family intramembrane serine protease [Gammaproteobacteria bacterium]|nr:rhomboid family intramembrane serine protease [Gammaproteobacteria bacterium]NNF66173.1 rhomboid family intramembrane serine protease [Gammaproteobacteria bacterium]